MHKGDRAHDASSLLFPFKMSLCLTLPAIPFVQFYFCFPFKMPFCVTLSVPSHLYCWWIKNGHSESFALHENVPTVGMMSRRQMGSSLAKANDDTMRSVNRFASQGPWMAYDKSDSTKVPTALLVLLLSSLTMSQGTSNREKSSLCFQPPSPAGFHCTLHHYNLVNKLPPPPQPPPPPTKIYIFFPPEHNSTFPET